VLLVGLYLFEELEDEGALLLVVKEF